MLCRKNVKAVSVPLLYGYKELPGEALANISDEYILSLTKKSVDIQKKWEKVEHIFQNFNKVIFQMVGD